MNVSRTRHAVTHAVTHAQVTPLVTVPPTRPDPTRPDFSVVTSNSNVQSVSRGSREIGFGGDAA